MLTIDVGTCTNDPRTLHKQPTLTITRQCYPYGNNVSVLQPTLILDYDPAIVTGNYLYIRDWQRYYYYRSEVMDGGKMVIRCRCDVLKSYEDYISDVDAYIQRSGNGDANYLPDGNIPIDARTWTENIKFDANPFGAGYYVLSVIGG